MHSTINAKGSKRMIWQNVITCICLRQVMIDHLHFFAFLSHFTHKCTRQNAAISIISAFSFCLVHILSGKVHVQIFVDRWQFASTNNSDVHMTGNITAFVMCNNWLFSITILWKSMWIRLANLHVKVFHPYQTFARMSLYLQDEITGVVGYSA